MSDYGEEIIDRLNPNSSLRNTDNPMNKIIQNTIGVKNQFDNKEIRVKYLIKYIGNEMIIQLTSDEQSREVLRCKLDDYNQHKSQMFEIIKEYYIEKINNIL